MGGYCPVDVHLERLEYRMELPGDTASNWLLGSGNGGYMDAHFRDKPNHEGQKENPVGAICRLANVGLERLGL